MDISTATAFLTYTFVMAYTPGPNNILILSSVGQYGLRSSSRLIGGVCAGFFAVMLLSGLFSLSLTRIVPTVLPWMLWVGAAYILWLAWHVAFSHSGSEDGASRQPQFVIGFLLQFVNVKVWLCGLTALSAFILPNTTETYSVLSCSLIMACIGSSGNLVWGLGGKVLKGAFQRWGRQLNLFLGVLLAYCGISMLV